MRARKGSDIFSRAKRSEIMSKIGPTDTKPEKALRSELYKLGLRYRLHPSNLPGKPDIIFSKQRIAVFINGCFWHRHENCRKSSLPKTHQDFWKTKLEGNVLRDKRNVEMLNKCNWEVIVVWECEIKRDASALASHIYNLLKYKALKS